MSKYNKNFGKMGENLAADYLVKKGYQILERNLYIGGGEIDIVAQKDKVTIIVEVKTRRSELYVALIDTLSDEKIDAIQQSCEEYIIRNSLDEREYRIDLIGVIISGGKVRKLLHEKAVI